MIDWKRWIVLGGSLMVLSLAIALSVWWITSPPKPPAPDQPSKVKTKPPEDLEVTLPGELQEEMEQEKDRRDQLYQQAIEAHRAGNFDIAAQNYRDAIALSIPDETAAESYRLLGDIYSRSQQWVRAIRLYQFAVELRPERALYHYRLGKALDERGDYESAVTSYENAIDRDPRALYFLARGNLEFNQGEFERAIEFYQQGLELEDHRQALLINLGMAYQDMDQQQQAIETYERARETELPTELGYRVAMNRGKLFIEEGNPQAAIEEFERARDLQQTTEAFYNLGVARLEATLWTGAVEALERARERSPEVVDIRVDLGFAYQQTGEYAEAVKEYEKAIELSAQNNDLYFAVARLYERLDQPRKALTYYRELTKRLPPSDQAPVWRRVGELFMNTNRPNEAAPAFRNALKVDTGNPEIHFNLGVSYHRSGQQDKAVQEFQSALSEESSDSEFRFVHASALYRAGFRDRAREQYMEIVNRTPDQYRAGYMIAYIDQSRGRLDKARNRYQSLLSDAKDPGLRSAIFQNLGYIYTKNERYSRAETVLRQALNVRENPMTFYNMGVVFAEQEKWKEANSSFRLALERGGNDPRIHAGLGLVLYERGLYKEAEEHLEQALKIDSGMTRARYDLNRVRKELETAS